jgi:hypothetical protein
MIISILPLFVITGYSVAAPTQTIPWENTTVNTTLRNLEAAAVAATPGAQRQRDETAVRYNLRRVNQALTPLENALNRKPRYWRTPQELDDYFHLVWDLGNTVVNELQQGAADIIYNAGTVSDAEALTLQRQVSAMDTSLTNVVTVIIASKRDVDQIYRRKEVLDLLIRAEIETNAFIESIINKLSGFSQALGRIIKSRFTNNLERGIRDYRR